MKKLWKTIKEMFPLDTEMQFKILCIATVYLCEGIKPDEKTLKNSTIKINWELVEKAITKPKQVKQSKQFEFCFEQADNKTEIKKYKKDNYHNIYEILLKKTLTLNELVELSGTTKKTVSKVITKMSYLYPLYSPKRGVYAVLPPLKATL